MNSTVLREKIGETSIVQSVIYDDKMPEYEKNVAIFVHTLKHGGSQRAVETLLKRFIQMGYGVFIFSPINGTYSEIFAEKYGAIIFITDESQCLNGTERDVLYHFDKVIINSIGGYRYAYYYLNKDIPCVWWVHEEEFVIKNMVKQLDPILLGSSNLIFAFPWSEPISVWNNYYPKHKTVFLPIEIEDNLKTPTIEDDLGKGNRLRILIPGSYQLQKGFHIALEAIIKLESVGISDYEAVFCGYVGDEEYYNTISEIAENHSNIKILKEISEEEMEDYISWSDCVIIPSLFDAGPLTAIEALKHRKLLIVSNSTGASGFVKDCESAFVFQNENTEELFKRLLLVYNDRVTLDNLRTRGRRVYENHFTKEKVDKFFYDLFGDI